MAITERPPERQRDPDASYADPLTSPPPRSLNPVPEWGNENWVEVLLGGFFSLFWGDGRHEMWMATHGFNYDRPEDAARRERETPADRTDPAEPLGTRVDPSEDHEAMIARERARILGDVDGTPAGEGLERAGDRFRSNFGNAAPAPGTAPRDPNAAATYGITPEYSAPGR